jgi:ATP-dependent helicase/nuclease subunit A
LKNFVIYKSSAGSGKTYTLVKEYLKLAFKSANEYRHILAVTFTNKAAEEMKSRIINSLIALSQGSDKVFEQQLIDEGVNGDIRYKASELLQNILHKYSYFSVTTIDSFFHKIIRAFAKELALPLGYKIELDSDLVLDKITEELLDEIGAHKGITKYIEDFVFYTMDDNKGWKIDRKIKDLGKELFRESYWIKKENGSSLADSREKIQSFIGTLIAMIREFEDNMIKPAEDARRIISEYSLEETDFKRGTFSYFTRLLNPENYPDKIEPTITSRRVLEGTDNWYAQKSFKKEQIRDASEAGLLSNLAAATDNYDNNLTKYITAKELIKTVYVLGIYRDLMDKLRDYRDKNKTMLISDTNNLLTSIIKGDNSPFVYEKTGGVYKNFLIDEFQDTSTFQWKNFLPLIENSLSENNFSMIVGDVKQSIYRWRNGNMQILHEGAKNDLSWFNDSIEEKYLNENYRSGKEIINFNNSFFSAAPQKLAERNPEENSLILSSYRDVSQNASAGKEEGYVNVTFIYSNEESELKPYETAIQKAIDAVNDALKDGYSQRDIMVLTRSNRDGVNIAHSLAGAGFKVVSEDSLLVTNSPKVRLLINILKYIADNKNYIAKTEILYNYLVYIKNEQADISAVFNDYKNNEDSMFSKLLPEEFFSKGNHSLLNPAMFRLNVYELVEMLTRIFKLNDSVDAYLLRFMEAVNEFASANSSDINGFLEWWNENKDEYSVIVPGEEDAVRVMTIHKAKGLESPVVILPFANWDMEMSDNRDLIWVSSEEPPFNESSAFFVKPGSILKKSYFKKDYIEEVILTNIDNLNLLYVAFTRAVERLHVFIPEKAFNRYHAGKLIYDVISSSEELKSRFNNSVYEAGEKAKNNRVDKFSGKVYKPAEILSGEYYSKIVIKPASQNFALEKEKKYQELRNRGIVLHKALSLIKYPDEAEQAIEQLKIEGLLTSENEDDYINELVEILKSASVKKWFSKEYDVKTESEVILPDGQICKPDRVLIKDGSAIVIDYKTGKHKKEHAIQVIQYADALAQMGYKSVEKYLYYVPEREIMKV